MFGGIGMEGVLTVSHAGHEITCKEEPLEVDVILAFVWPIVRLRHVEDGGEMGREDSWASYNNSKNPPFTPNRARWD